MQKIDPVQKGFSAFYLWMALTATIVASAAQARAAAALTIQAEQPGAIISSNLFGIFFEEINFAGEGGLCAEMVRDRALNALTCWTPVKQGTASGRISRDASEPFSTSLPNSLKVTMPMSGVQAVRNIIGTDNWPDPGLQGTIDEFRIYNGALTADEIAATQVLGPDQLSSTARPASSASATVGGLALSWPVASAGCTVLTTTNPAAGDWVAAAVTPQLVGSQWQVLLPITGNTRFYRLQK